jgi:hypothetical protein
VLISEASSPGYGEEASELRLPHLWWAYRFVEKMRKNSKKSLTHTGVLMYDSEAPLAQSAMMREIARFRGNFRGVCP